MATHLLPLTLALTPRPFPAAATYTAHLVTTEKSQLCSRCTFDGLHHYNSDPSKAFGHVAWFYGPTNNASDRVSFLDIFLGAKQQMFLVQDTGPTPRPGEHSAECMKVAPYPAPIFNHTWAADAQYMGTAYYQHRMCHAWSGVYPFFIQGEIYPSVYYEDVFTGLPVGFTNEVEQFWYDTNFAAAVPADELFTNVASLNCSSAPPHAAAAFRQLRRGA